MGRTLLINRIHFVVAFGLLTLTGVSPARAADAEPLLTYAGDGLSIAVTEFSEETGAVAGVIRRGGDVWPFTGKTAEEGGAEITRGTFTVGGASHAFTSKQTPGSDDLVFTTGKTTYRLKLNEPKAPAPANPLDGPAKTPATPPSVPAEKSPEKPAADRPGELPPVMRLRQHRFNDVSMGGPPAYTAITPEDWTSDGKIEWQNIGEVPFPQMIIKIESPQGGRLAYVPNTVMNFMNAPGLGQRQGEPAPENFPQWLINILPRVNPKISNVKLESSVRDQKNEQALLDMDRATNANTAGNRRECWIINFTYDEGGTRRREETAVTYNAFAPFNGLNGFFTQSWMISVLQSISAPVEVFEAQRPLLYGVAGSVRPTLRWYTASQAVIAENSRQRTANVWQQIKARGEQISRMHVTPADESAYSKGIGAGIGSDASQRQRINGIYETEDYKDTDGSTLNLSMHYKHTWSDGNGRIVQSNNSNDKPGAAWDPLEPMKQ